MLFLGYRKQIVIITLLLAVLAGYYATSLYFYHDLDRFLPKDLDDHEFLKDFDCRKK